MSSRLVSEERLEARFRSALLAVESVGAALMTLYKKKQDGREGPHGQLKTAIDLAAEGWLLGYLRAIFPEDNFLAEESYEQSQTPWLAPDSYWTIDALDGTRSFVEGFDGFCVQVAYVQHGQVQVAVIHEPARRATYWALAGQGAFFRTADEGQSRLQLQAVGQVPQHPIFVDSTRPSGRVAEIMDRWSGQLLECGSIGVKICRVADRSADIFVKKLVFKLWDVAPGHLILQQAGGRLGLWTGDTIPFDTAQVYFENLLAARSGLFEGMVEELSCSEGKA